MALAGLAVVVHFLESLEARVMQAVPLSVVNLSLFFRRNIGIWSSRVDRLIRFDLPKDATEASEQLEITWGPVLSINRLVFLCLILKGPIKEIFLGFLLRPDGVGMVAIRAWWCFPSYTLATLPGSFFVTRTLALENARVHDTFVLSAGFILAVVTEDKRPSAKPVRVAELRVYGSVVQAVL